MELVDEQYLKLRTAMPKETDDSWIGWLTENNNVVYEDSTWVVIENYKYHSHTNTHFTIFPKDYCETWGDISPKERKSLFRILDRWEEWTVYRNRSEKRTIKRFHLHLAPWIEIRPKLKDEQTPTTRENTTGPSIPMVGLDVS